MSNVWWHRRGQAQKPKRPEGEPAPLPPEMGRYHDVRCFNCGSLLMRVRSLKGLRAAGAQLRCRKCKQTMTAQG